MNPRRSLAAILFTDIVGSTERASEMGDRAWGELQSRHHRILREEFRRWGGEEVTEAGDGFLAVFDGAARAIACADAARHRIREIGLEIRSSVHMGQIERAPDGSAGGIAVHVGARAMGKAAPGEIVVTSAVRDAETGSGFGFEDLGSHELKGVDREWRLFRVTSLPDDLEAVAPGRWESIRRRAGSRALALAAIALVAVMAAIGVIRFRGPGEAVASEIRSIGVLPLDNLTGDPGQQYLVDGMTEALIAELSKVGELNVISRTSTERFRESEKPLPEIAEELNVVGVVEGSVARAGDRVRITAQLIHAPTDTHVWAETYEGEMAELPSLQGEMARTIARQIEVALTPEERRRLERAEPIDPEAYETYLRGRYHLGRQTPEGVERGLALLEEAVELDPDAALPHAGLALGYSLAAHGPNPPPDAFRRARASARRALELDESLAETHAALAQIRMYQDWDWEGAAESFRRALELNPSLPEARAHYSWYLQLIGERDEALSHMRRARRADPLNPLWTAWLAWQLWEVGDLEGAIEEARASLELNPDFPVGHYVLGSVLASQGRYEEALDHHERAAGVSPRWRFALGVTHARAGNRAEALRVARELEADPSTWDTFFIAQIHTLLGDEEEAFRWLEEAYARPHHPYVPWIARAEAFRPLHDDPRFLELQRRMDLPEGALVEASASAG
ncbi:MAG: tetratricopeptide repeat protein [Gemmatimonadota bacterium]|nr:tetratricopeptide repeat protein [Gemmatimonadota bacterium]